MIINDINVLGESPIYNYFSNQFYWVDIISKQIKSLNNTETICSWHLDKMPTCLALIDGNCIFASVEDGLGIYDFRNNSYNYLIKNNFDNNIRFNDGKCDKNGIFHIGTMDMNEKEYIGNIYKFENNILNTLYENVGISNGISFTSTNEMYHSDSLKGEIYKNGNLIKKYEQFEEKSPDGSTIDNNDNYYSCLWGGKSIDVFNLKDNLSKSICLEMICPTCCCFGGEHFDKLLVTSSNLKDISGNNGKLCLLDNMGTGIKEPVVKII